jgi:fatty-acyl-CoA synthase
MSCCRSIASSLDKHAFDRVIVFPFSGAKVDPEFLDYEQLLERADGDALVYAPHEEDDPIAMCYTSGTTGRPKGVAYSHRSTVLHSLVGCLADFWGLKGTDVVLPVTPMFHANSWGIPYAAVMLGVKMVFPGPHLAPRGSARPDEGRAADARARRADDLDGIDPALRPGAREAAGRWKLPTGMRSLVGGSAVPESLIRAFARHGVWIVQGWGMTETSPIATVSYQRNELKDAGDDERFRRAAMAGVPVPLVDVRIRTDEGGDAPHDGRTMGEIQVRGPFITGSYHEVPRSADKFTDDGWLRTGDVATIDELAFVRITDRTKDLIKSGGEWISSVDLENALMAHPAIAEAAVIAIPDEKWSERPLACIVLKPGTDLAGDRLRDDLGRHLLGHGFAKWQLPDRYEVIDAVPRTSTGSSGR